MSKNIGIYCWTSPSGKKYIGQSTDLKRRRKNFLCFTVDYSGIRINRARKKYNQAEDWEYQVLEYCSEDLLDERETYWIEYFDTLNCGYNLESGGHENKHLSSEVRQKMSGRIPWNKGKTNCYSEESRKKMSEKHIGRIPWNKGLEGFTPWNKGKSGCYSDETLKKFSESRKGHTPWNKGKVGIDIGPEDIPIIAICIIDGRSEEFESIKQASFKLSIDHSNISKVCRGKRKSACGYIFRYKEE